MPFPSSIDSYTPPSGTTLVTTIDHAGQHTSFGSAITNIENKLGLGSGSAAANQILVGSGSGTASWGSVWNSAQLGTPTITGGTLANITFSGNTITTSAFNGGTSGTLINTGGLSLKDNGSITQTGTADNIYLTPGASKQVKQQLLSQSNVTNSYLQNQVMLVGEGSFVGNGSTIGTVTVTFGGTFTNIPRVFANFAGYGGTTSYGYTGLTNFPAIFAQAQNPGTTTMQVTLNRTDGGALGNTNAFYFTWLAIGSM